MINVTFVTFHYVIIYTEESVDVPQTCTFICFNLSKIFLHKALSRAYAERECMNLRSAHTVSWFPVKANA